jgi:integrase
MGRRMSWLPDNVTPYKDRHGKERYRFRRKGLPTYHFRSTPGTEAFREEYAACQAALPVKGDRWEAGTVDWLAARFYETVAWREMAASSKTTYRGIIERFRDSRNKKGRRYGSLPVALIKTRHLDRIFEGMADRPAAANNLRKVLKRMFRLAVKLELRDDNPAVETDAYRQGRGFHTWTEEEIAQYRARHPLGTKPRLALELLLNTAARRCNVVALTRADLKAGKFHIAHVKGGDETIVAALPETLVAIETMQVAGIGHYLVTEFGKPFSAAGFGNWFRERCDEAGLPQCSAHGLRKAMSRRLAESGATDAQGRAVTGQKKNQTFAYYAAKANREHLADAAMANLGEPDLANPGKD